jgi:ELWxxDGT repeat protein
VADIATGPAGSYPSDFGQLGETLVFFASEPRVGMRLWRSDGTAAGTTRVTAPDLGPRIPDPPRFWDMGDTRFFTADDAARGLELWRSDGTAAGTFPVADVMPGPEGSSPSDLMGLDDTLVFTATGPDGGRRLWRTDGTPEGTAPLAVVDDGPGGTAFRHTGDALLVFLGLQVWRTDGTADGTALLADFRHRGAPGYCFGWETADLGGAVLFPGYDADAGLALWRSDGTTAGTARVAGIERLGESSWPTELTQTGGRLFFTAWEPVGGWALWATDGTPAGTTRLSDTAAFRALGVDGTLFWTGYRSLWTSDGTSAGTRAIVDDTSSRFWQAEHLTEVNGTLFFRAFDGGGASGLWKSDGTAAGTVPVASFACPSSALITGLNGTLFLSIGGGGCPGDVALWKSDGTREGTVRVASISQDTFSFLCSKDGGRTCYAAVGDVLFFGAERDGPDDTFDLWKSDGTEAGTTLIAHLGGYPSDFTPLDGTRLFFKVDSAPWASDGTPAGTQPLTRSAPALDLTTAEGTVFFSMGGTLWRSDGTPNGTFQVAPDPTGVRILASHDATILVSAREPEGGLALWQSDGTAAGTTRVYGLAPSFLSLTPPAAVLNGGLVLPATEPAHGIELWRLSTGTHDHCPSDPPSPPGTCLPSDDRCAVSRCDDGDPCTLDGCTPREGCTHTPLAGCAATTTSTTTTTTTTRVAPTATSTSTIPCNGPCNDGDPCTVDRCEAGICRHDPPGPSAGLRCVLDGGGLDSAACRDVPLPRPEVRAWHRIRARLDAVGAGDDRRVLRRARHALAAAQRAARRVAARRGRGDPCAAAMARFVRDARQALRSLGG